MAAWNNVKNGALFSVGALSVLGFAAVSFSAWNASMPTAASGSVLSADGWNAVVSNVADLNSRVTALGSKSGGSVITHWGSNSVPAGTTQIMSGYAFASHYGHQNNLSPVCLEGGNPGAVSANYATNNGALFYPMGTGDAGRMAPGISPSTHVRCNKTYYPGPTFESFGTDSCPAGWNVLYSGYGMSGYYGHYGDVSVLLCVDSTGFDTGKSWTWSSGGAFLSAAYVANSTDTTNYPLGRYMKCAVCGKN